MSKHSPRVYYDRFNRGFGLQLAHSDVKVVTEFSGWREFQLGITVHGPEYNRFQAYVSLGWIVFGIVIDWWADEWKHNKNGSRASPVV